MPTEFWVNDVDVYAATGFRITDLPDALHTVEERFEGVNLPGDPRTYLNVLSTYAPKTVLIAGAIETQDAATVALARTALKELEAVCQIGQRARYRMMDRDDLFLYARLARVTANPRSAGFVVPDLSVALQLYAAEFPFWQDVTALTPAIVAATPAAIATGTRPSDYVLRVTGATGFTMTWRNSSAATVFTATFAGGGAGGADWIEIDTATGLIRKSVSAVVTTDYDLLDIASRFPPKLNPAWGNYLTPAWPTLEVSAGTTIALTYRRCFG